MPAFDRIVVWNPSPSQRLVLQNFTIPCRDIEAVTLADRFYVPNALGDGQNIECSVEAGGHLDPNIGTRVYRVSRNRARVRLAVPMRLPPGPGYTEFEVWRGTNGVVPSTSPRLSVLQGLSQARITLRPFGNGGHDIVVYDPLLNPRSIKRTTHSTVYEYWNRAAQPRQNGGNPFQGRAIIEVPNDPLDHCRAWLEWRCFDTRDQLWFWDQALQVNPDIRWIVTGASEHFPYARIIGRGQWHTWDQQWDAAIGAHILTVDRQNSLANNVQIHYGQHQMRMMSLWFAPAAGQFATGDALRDATRDCETNAFWDGSAWVRNAEGTDRGRETHAMSTSEYAKQEASFTGIVKHPPINSVSVTTRNTGQLMPECEYLSRPSVPGFQGGTVQNVRAILTWEAEAPDSINGQSGVNRRVYRPGTWHNNSGGAVHGFSTSVLLGSYSPITDNGAASDHQNFGNDKLWPQRSVAECASLESVRLSMYGYGNCCWYTEADGSNFSADAHPLMFWWNGGLHSSSADQFGKPYDGIIRTSCRDVSGVDGNGNGTTWVTYTGPELAHWEDGAHCEYAVISGDRGAIDMVAHMAEIWRICYPRTGPRANALGSQDRGIGRRLLNYARYYYATGKQGCFDDFAHSATLITAQKAATTATFPNRIIFNLGSVHSPTGGGSGSDGFHWRPGEESVIIAGLHATWKEGGLEVHRLAAIDSINAVIRFGHDLHCDANGLVWAHTRAGANSVRWHMHALVSSNGHPQYASHGGIAKSDGTYAFSRVTSSWPEVAQYGSTSVYHHAAFTASHDPDYQFHLDPVMRVYQRELAGTQYTIARLPVRTTNNNPTELNNNAFTFYDQTIRYRLVQDRHVGRPNAYIPHAPFLHGINIATSFHWEKALIWTNFMRNATRFGHFNSPNGSVLSYVLPNQRTDGYPASLANNTEARCTLGDGHSAFLGPHKLRWDGRGHVRLNTGSGEIGNEAIGACPVNGYDFTPIQGYDRFTLYIRGTDALDPVRNVRVYYAPYEQYLSQSEGGSVGSRGFHPDFAARFRRAKWNCLRTLDYLFPWSDVVSTSADILHDTYYTQNSLDENHAVDLLSRQGCSIGTLIDFCNEFDLRYLWVTIPSRTWSDTAQSGGLYSETWINEVANRILAECSPRLQVVWENSNEVWNSANAAFVMNQSYYSDAALLGGPRGEAPRPVIVGQSDWDRMSHAYAYRTDQIGQFIRRHAISPRSLVALAWQAEHDHDYRFPILTRIHADAAGNPYAVPQRTTYDVYSVSNYTGFYMQQRNGSAAIRNWTPAQFGDYLRNEMDTLQFANEATNRPAYLRSVPYAAVLAARDGKLFATYEGGPHASINGDSPDDNAARVAWDAFCVSPEGYAFIRDLYGRLRNIPNLLGWNYYYDTQGGEFGITREWRDDGGNRPGSAGCDNEQLFLAMAQFGVDIFGTNRAPTCQQLGTQTMREGDAITPFRAIGSDPDGDRIRYSVAGQPTGIVINADTGEFTGTPGVGTGRVPPYPTTVTVTDIHGAQGTMTFSIFVSAGSGGQNPPVITQPLPLLTNINAVVSFQIVATDPDPGDVLTYSADTLPPGLSISSTTGLVTGTVGGTANTFYLVKLNVRDQTGLHALPREWTIHVRAAVNENLPPTLAAIANQTAILGTPFTVTATATDPENATMRWEMANAPAWLTLTPVPPNQATIAGTPPPFSLELGRQVTVRTFDDINQMAVRTFTLDVIPEVRHPPTVVEPGTVNVVAGQELNVIVEATDPNPTDVMTWTIPGAPAWASIASIARLMGRVTGTVPSNAGGTQIPIVIRATDTSAQWDEATLTVDVAHPNRPPVLTQPANQVGTELIAFTFTPTATDPDAGDVLTWACTGLPQGVTCNPSTGVISGTPTLGTALASPYFPTLRCTDRGGLFDEKTFRFTVAANVPGNSPPELTNPGPKAEQVGVLITSFQLVATDPDFDNLTFAMSGGPQGVTCDASTGDVTGTPAAGSDRGSPYLVTYEVADGFGHVDQELAVFTVAPGGGGGGTNPPVWVTVPGDQSNDEGAVISIATLATDPDQQAITYTATRLPNGLAIHTTTGLISGTILAGARQFSPFNVTLVATDTTGRFDEHRFTWTITQPGQPQPPSIRQIESQVGYEQTPVVIILTATVNHPDGQLVWSMTGAPRQLNISNLGAITGTLAPGTSAGSPWTIRVSARNSHGLTHTMTFLLSVRAQTGSSGRFRRFNFKMRRKERRKK